MAWSVHGFTSRVGGASSGPRETLNLARCDDETDEVFVENWTRVLLALGMSGGTQCLALMNQVHGGDVVEVTRPSGPFGTVGAVDAMVTRTQGVCLVVRVADCVPVILATKGAVGVAHAGWRGVAAGVVPAAVTKLCQISGAAPAEISIVLGPHISAEVYEVGPEVVDGIERSGVERACFAASGRADRWFVDLGVAIRVQLERMGVVVIENLNRCTSNPEFYSYRHDGLDTGRQAGLVMLR